MSIFCPFCGEELVDNAKFCKNCGKNVESYRNMTNDTSNTNSFNPPVVEKSHTLATVLGFIFSILIPLIGIIIGIYLYTRKDSPKAKRYGLLVIVLGVGVWIISFFLGLFMY